MLIDLKERKAECVKSGERYLKLPYRVHSFRNMCSSLLRQYQVNKHNKASHRGASLCYHFGNFNSSKRGLTGLISSKNDDKKIRWSASQVL